MKPKPVIYFSTDILFRQFSILKTSYLKFLMIVVCIQLGIPVMPLSEIKNQVDGQASKIYRNGICKNN